MLGLHRRVINKKGVSKKYIYQVLSACFRRWGIKDKTVTEDMKTTVLCIVLCAVIFTLSEKTVYSFLDNILLP